MRVLLIEDDRSAARSAQLMLAAEKFNVETTESGEDGIDLAQTYDYDIILLDLNLGDMSGLDVLRGLRRNGCKTPVMIVSGSADVAVKVRAFSGGADDYIVKPFHKDELTARLRAVIRRSSGHADSVITIGDIALNIDARTVHVNGTRVHLTGKEYQTLELLALRRGKTLHKDVFLTSLYGGMDEPGGKIIDVFICKLRQKLAAVSDKQHIETVWGGGYVMRDPQETPAQQAA
ncbi:MAG TPA: response regulator transcription factor [Phenylobacterium sp.]|jgi:two-component system cell cycle response regulator CtrA|nr:response regulator transcription factor [Phenylobacterium sp.]